MVTFFDLPLTCMVHGFDLVTAYSIWIIKLFKIDDENFTRILSEGIE